MKHAAKLALDVPMPFLEKENVLDGARIIKKHGYSLNKADKPRAIRRYLPRNQTELVRDKLPEDIKHGLLLVNLSEMRLLAPHIHLEEMSIINFYIEAGGEKTSFWDGEIISSEDNLVDNGNGYLDLRRDVLTECEHFIAKPGDVWVIDSAFPHSVSYVADKRDPEFRYEPIDDQPRIIMQAYFNIPFTVIKDSLKDMVIF